MSAIDPAAMILPFPKTAMRSHAVYRLSRSWVTMKTVRPKVRCRVADQLVEVAGADRIEARGRLIEEDQFRIERQRARQRHALDHAAGEFRRKTVGNLGPQPHHAEFGHRNLVEQPLRDVEIFAHRELDVLSHGQRGKQRALLEQDAPAPLDAASRAASAASRSIPNTSMLPLILGTRPMMVRVSTDLPAPEGPTKPRISPRFTSRSRRSRTLVCAELHRDIANPDDRVGYFRRHRHIPIDAKKIANTPSMTITKKIPFTTEDVVCCPSDSALPSHRKPLDARDDPDHRRHHRRLDDTDGEMIDRDRVAQAKQERFGIDAAIQPRHQPAAIQAPRWRRERPGSAAR